MFLFERRRAKRKLAVETHAEMCALNASLQGTQVALERLAAKMDDQLMAVRMEAARRHTEGAKSRNQGVFRAALPDFLGGLYLVILLLIVKEGPTWFARGRTALADAARSADSLRESLVLAFSIIAFAVTLISVALLIGGGLRYVTSAGDADSIARAKKTITYASVGIAIASLLFSLLSLLMP
jgi:hypothetical protein